MRCWEPGTNPRSADPATPPAIVRDPGSYRDPSGFVYRRDGRLLRQINRSYAAHWDRLIESGFLQGLAARGWLIPFTVEPISLAADPALAHAVIAPEPLELVTYPYEWTFSAFKEAALLTLDVQEAAQAGGFTLKDASAYNIQFHHGRPVLIDTLSFEVAEPGAPWAGYRQFCEQFLGPLAVMAYRDVRLVRLLQSDADGLPLDLASRLLPARTKLRFGLLSHLHIHARAQRRDASGAAREAPEADAATRQTDDRGGTGRGMGDLRRAALIDSLRTTVAKLTWDPPRSAWAGYAESTSYSPAATRSKDEIVAAMLAATGGGTVWDLGANTGRYSRMAAEAGKHVVAFDNDALAAERHQRAIRAEGLTSILPLVVDVANPSPAIGWAGRERSSLADRANADVLLALALVHHLAITRNIPLRSIASWFARLASEALVEFVPKADPMVGRMLASREDIFDDYTIDGFRAAMRAEFEIVREAPIADSRRVLFLLRRRGEPAAG